MHAQIVRDAPGACPICGMALELRTVAAEDTPNAELLSMRRRFFVSLGPSSIVFLMGMSDLLPGMPLHYLLGARAVAWIEFALATPVVLWGAWPFFVRAWQSLANRSLNMFTLFGLGIGVAYGYSVVALFIPGIFPPSFRGAGGVVAVYFEAAAVIVALVLLGQLVEIVAGNGDDAALIRLTASLEQGSEHPLAAAIVDGAKTRGVALVAATDFASTTGKGVTGTIDGHHVALGNQRMMDDLHVVAGGLAAKAEAMRGDGQTVMFVAVDGTIAGLIGVADPIKATTADAIRSLHAEGIRVVMLTGDSKTTAQAVATTLGIDELIAEVMPDQKAATIKRLQTVGRIVAMGTGTDVAMSLTPISIIGNALRLRRL